MASPSRYPLWIAARLTPLATLIWLLGWANPANAEDAPEPVSLSYRAPAQCPSQAEFLNEVRRSTPRMRLADANAAASVRRFEIAIAENGLAGKLTIDGGRAGMREARGGSCAAVSRLLAFATALAVDPDATPKGDEPSALPPPTKPAAVSDAPAATPVARAAGQAVQLGGSIGVFGSVQGASAPSNAYGGGAFGDLQLRSLPVRPWARLGLGYSGSAAVLLRKGGTVSFSDTFALLDACPVSLESGRWSLAPCARFAAIRTTAEASHEVPGGHTVHPFQIDLGLDVHVRARVLRSLFAELDGGLLLPVRRPAVTLHGAGTVHEIPSVAAFAELSLGVEFR